MLNIIEKIIKAYGLHNTQFLWFIAYTSIPYITLIFLMILAYVIDSWSDSELRSLIKVNKWICIIMSLILAMGYLAIFFVTVASFCLELLI